MTEQRLSGNAEELSDLILDTVYRCRARIASFNDSAVEARYINLLKNYYFSHIFKKEELINDIKNKMAELNPEVSKLEIKMKNQIICGVLLLELLPVAGGMAISAFTSSIEYYQCSFFVSQTMYQNTLQTNSIVNKFYNRTEKSSNVLKSKDEVWYKALDNDDIRNSLRV